MLSWRMSAPIRCFVAERPALRMSPNHESLLARCGVRTTRQVNPRALKTGTVYVQCGGCEVWHNIADNLSWMGQLYDFRDGKDGADSESAAAREPGRAIAIGAEPQLQAPNPDPDPDPA